MSTSAPPNGGIMTPGGEEVTPIVEPAIRTAFELLDVRSLEQHAIDDRIIVAATELYVQVRRSCLASADWSFASEHLPLAPDASAPERHDFPHAYQFAGATSYVVRDVLPGPARWRLDGVLLRTDVPPPAVARVTNLGIAHTRMTAPFLMALAHELAALLNPKFGSKTGTDRQALLDQAERWRRQALRADQRAHSGARYDDEQPGADWRGLVWS